jgi:23S rRNA (uracil1939-C5)-methyltransferase
VKRDIQERGWSIYTESEHRGKLRHLGLRIGRRTGEMLLLLVATSDKLPGLTEQAEAWVNRYPNLMGVCLNLNPHRTNAILGEETRCLAGQPFLREEFAGLQFHLTATTFFQVHTEQAESLLQDIVRDLALTGNELVVDAYCGVGTLTLPIAQHCREAIAFEVQAEAVEQAQHNAVLNQITNVTFQTGTVETLLPTLTTPPDVVLLDPPRKGCDGTVIEALRSLHPARIIYVSCNPSTLARDLKLLCSDGSYHLRRVRPADFFPQTAHVECAAFLESGMPA